MVKGAVYTLYLLHVVRRNAVLIDCNFIRILVPLCVYESDYYCSITWDHPIIWLVVTTVYIPCGRYVNKVYTMRQQVMKGYVHRTASQDIAPQYSVTISVPIAQCASHNAQWLACPRGTRNHHSHVSFSQLRHRGVLYSRQILVERRGRSDIPLSRGTCESLLLIHRVQCILCKGD